MDVDEEDEIYEWNDFEKYCIEEGIGLEDSSDYRAWWHC